MIGHAALKKFAYRSVIFEGLERSTIRGTAGAGRRAMCSSRIAPAKSHGDRMQVPGEFHARLTSTLNPKALQPLLSGTALEALLAV